MTAVIPTPRDEAVDDSIYALTELEIQADESCAEELAPSRLKAWFRSLILFYGGSIF
ncbi:hypothetical protein ACPSKX_17160 [Moritella viscosa]